MDEKEYLKGFNRGYELQKHSPELTEKLKKAVKGSEREIDQGFLSGAKEYELERLEKHSSKPVNYRIPERGKEDIEKGMSDRSNDRDLNR